ncbi:MAG: carboxypeptidase regulatory-like domain-containing protein [Acidobacteriaceae bacterium]
MRVRVWSLTIAVWVVCALLGVTRGLAQTAVDGAIGGTVTDSSGAVIPQALVDVHNDETNADQTAKTDNSGYFRVVHLLPGRYTVTVTAKGFSTYRSEDLTVNVGMLTTVQARLKVGTAAQTVTVTGAAPLVDTSTPTFSQVIGSYQLSNLPVNNYRWSSYALLTPGVVNDANGYGLLSFRGQSTLLNNVEFDGADDNQAFYAEERGRTRAGYSTAKAAVKEFQVNTSNYSVEYGFSAGGVVNAVSKSGTNHFHGEVYYYDRDSAWNAYNDFTTLTVQSPTTGGFVTEPFKPTDLRRQYGFGVGGPIVKDKLFFFLAVDRFYHDFPGVSTPGNTFFYTQPDATVANGCSATAQKGYSTIDADVCSLANNLTNAGLPTTYAQAYTDYTQGIAGLNTMLGEAPRFGSQMIYFPKLDWQINARNHASFEYNRLNWHSPAGIQTGAGALHYGKASYGNDYVRDNWGIARLDSFITNNVSNEALYQYGRDFEFEFNQTPTPYEEATLIKTSDGYRNPFGNVPPEVNISSGNGGFEFGTPSFLNRPAFPDERTWQFNDTVEWTHGNHDLKFGYQMIHTNDLSENLRSQYGAFSYSQLYDYFTDYYLSQAGGSQAGEAKNYSSYAQGFGTLGFDIDTTDYATFVQDEWKVNPRLSLTMGIRWEYEQTPNPQLPNTDNANPAYNIPQTGVLPKDKTNVGPRVGFAWEPFGDGNTVLRGGYGLFFARVINATIYNAIAQTGVLTTDPNGTPLAQLQFSYNPSTAGAPAFPQVVTTAGTAGSPPNVVYFDPNFKLPEIDEADLTLEQKFGAHNVMGITWLGAWGHRLPDFVDQNLPTPVTVTYVVNDPSGKGPLPNGTKLPVDFYEKAATTKVALSNGVIATSSGRPNPYYGAETDIFSGVNSNYEGLVVTYSHPFSDHFEINANYTWSHALDYGENNITGTSTNALFDPSRIRLDYGNSNQNVPNRLVVNGVFTSPWSEHGLLGYLTNGYQIAPDVQVQNGLPYSAGTSGNPYVTVNGIKANYIGGGATGSGGAARTPGLQRNYARMPNTAVVDLRISKQIAIKGKSYLEFMGEAFNLFNHQNVTALNTTAYNFGSPSSATCGVNQLCFNAINSGGNYVPQYGKVTNSNSSGFAYTPRQLQLAVKLVF